MITPGDSPSSPSNFAAVTPHGQGTAPYDVQAPQADVSGVFDAANAVVGPRQSATEALMQSAPGSADFNILTGSAAGWPVDITPPGA